MVAKPWRQVAVAVPELQRLGLAKQEGLLQVRGCEAWVVKGKTTSFLLAQAFFHFPWPWHGRWFHDLGTSWQPRPRAQRWHWLLLLRASRRGRRGGALALWGSFGRLGWSLGWARLRAGGRQGVPSVRGLSRGTVFPQQHCIEAMHSMQGRLLLMRDERGASQ